MTLRISTVAEVLADFINTLETTYDEALQVELGSDTHVHILVERIEVGDEWAGRSTIKEWAEIGVSEDWAYVLRKAGFNLISDIREEKAQGLQQKIGEINKKYKLGYEKPSVDDIQGWIDRSNVEC